MATPFKKIYDKFFLLLSDDGKIRIFKLSEEDMNEYLYALLEESIANFKSCKEKLINRNYELQQFDKELSDEELSILANGMILVWLKPKIMRLNNLKQSMTDRDFKMSSNWQTLNSLITLKENTNQEITKKILDYTYNDISKIKVKK